MWLNIVFNIIYIMRTNVRFGKICLSTAMIALVMESLLADNFYVYIRLKDV